jgi:hypothetical protein
LNSDWRSSSRFRIWAWIETSSADTGSGDADALALAARELVGEPVVVLGVQPHQLHKLPDLVLDLPARGGAVEPERLADDAPHGLARIQGSERVLEDHLHLAPDLPQALALEIGDLLPVEEDPAIGRVVQPHDDASQRGLAAARLPHQADRLARVDLEVDAIHGVDLADLALNEDAPGDGEVLLQPLDPDQRRLPRLRGRLRSFPDCDAHLCTKT